jgi:hypothetical protein
MTARTTRHLPPDQAPLLELADGVGDRGGVDHEPCAHLPHGQRAGPGEGEQPQCFIGGEGQRIRFERILDAGEQELLHAHDRGDGGHAVRLLGPPRRPLAERLGDGIEGLGIGHALTVSHLPTSARAPPAPPRAG